MREYNITARLSGAETWDRSMWSPQWCEILACMICKVRFCNYFPLTSLPQKSQAVCPASPSHQPADTWRRLIKSINQYLSVHFSDLTFNVIRTSSYAVLTLTKLDKKKQNTVHLFSYSCNPARMCELFCCVCTFLVEHLSHLGQEPPWLSSQVWPRACGTTGQNWPGRPKHSPTDGVTQQRGWTQVHSTRGMSRDPFLLMHSWQRYRYAPNGAGASVPLPSDLTSALLGIINIELKGSAGWLCHFGELRSCAPWRYLTGPHTPVKLHMDTLSMNLTSPNRYYITPNSRNIKN